VKYIYIYIHDSVTGVRKITVATEQCNSISEVERELQQGGWSLVKNDRRSYLGIVDK
jgi:hypothetical protein